MIIRILGGGQYRVADSDLVELNKFDDALEAAVADGNAAQVHATLGALHQQVRTMGEELPDDELAESDLVLPAADASIDELREALGSDGLLPG
ncbi:MAG: PspA-associated protein PspAA [Propionibacteriaceae bacterium]